MSVVELGRPYRAYTVSIIGVANGKCETLRDGETSVFLCETETSKCFECERETFKLLKFEPQIWFRAMRRYDNELELACTKVLRRRLLL